MTAGSNRRGYPPWTTKVLRAACAYHVAWGAWVVADPNGLLRWASEPDLTARWTWQVSGLMGFALGIGYAVAARGPMRHWPVVLVGFLEKSLEMLGFVTAAGTGAAPWSLGTVVLIHDVVWWIPFAMILYQAVRHHSDVASGQPAPGRELLMASRLSQRGRTITELSFEKPLMLVFLRHAGCVFCREALDDLRQDRDAIEREGVRIALVHMSSPLRASLDTAKYALDDLHRFSDPECHLYRAFALERGTWRQLFGWFVFRRAIGAILRGHGVGALIGDGFRMPGVFRIERGRIMASYAHRTAADRPDYVALARGTVEPAMSV